MSFLPGLTNILKKVAPVALPIAASFIPGIGPGVASALQASGVMSGIQALAGSDSGAPDPGVYGMAGVSTDYGMSPGGIASGSIPMPDSSVGGSGPRLVLPGMANPVSSVVRTLVI